MYNVLRADEGRVNLSQRIASSNRTLDAMQGPWANPSLAIAYSASAC